MKKLSEDSIALFASVKEKMEINFGESRSAQFVQIPVSLILLGDHTHYNDGILVSTALDKYVALGIKKRDDKKIFILSGEDESPIEITGLDEPEGSNHFKIKLIVKLLSILKAENKLPFGFEVVIVHNIPESFGLGSNAAALAGVLYGLNSVFELGLKNEEMAEITARAEREQIGKIANRSNHYTIFNTKENRLFFFDVRSRAFGNLSMGNGDYKIVLCDTGEKITNSQNICNERIEECEVGVKGLRLYIWGIKNLRDVNPEFLQRHVHMLPKRIFNRILYNVSERQRVETALKGMKKYNMKLLGEKIFESHNSLSEEYELVSEEVDFLVTAASECKGVIGSKLVSCSSIKSTYTIVESEYVENFVKCIEEKYFKKFGAKLNTHILEINGGIRNISYKELILSL